MCSSDLFGCLPSELKQDKDIALAAVQQDGKAIQHLPEELQSMFVALYRETHRIENPGENERREYFRPLVTSCSAPPPKPSPAPAAREQLEVLPAPESRSLTAREEKRLRRKEETLLRELRIFLRDIWAKINRESKFFMFRSPVNTEDVDDYLQFVQDPMDLEKMHMKLDDGEYSCAQTFLDDIDLIAENAITYNCDQIGRASCRERV